MRAAVALWLLAAWFAVPALAWGAGPAAASAPVPGMRGAATVPVGRSANAMLLAPDGRTLYVTNGGGVAHGSDTTVTVIDMGGARATATIGTPVTNPTHPRVSMDGRTLLVQSGSGDDRLVGIDAATGAVASSTRTPGMVYYAASPDAAHVVGVFAGGGGREVNGIAAITAGADAVGGSLSLRPAGVFLTPLALSADGGSLYGLLAYASGDGVSHWVRIEAATGRIVKDYGPAPGDMNLVGDGDAIVSPDGATLYLPVAGGSSTRLLLVATASGTIRRRLNVPVAARYVRATPDGGTVLSVSGRGRAAVTDTADGSTRGLAASACPNGALCAVAPDGGVVYAVDADAFRLTATDTRTGGVGTMRLDTNNLSGILVSGDGTRLALLDGGVGSPGQGHVELVDTGRVARDATPTAPDGAPAHGAVRHAAWIRDHAGPVAGILALVITTAILAPAVRHARRRRAAPRHRGR